MPPDQHTHPEVQYNFSACSPARLNENITWIANTALPPPFKNGLYQAYQGHDQASSSPGTSLLQVHTRKRPRVQSSEWICANDIEELRRPGKKRRTASRQLDPARRATSLPVEFERATTATRTTTTTTTTTLRAMVHPSLYDRSTAYEAAGPFTKPPPPKRSRKNTNSDPPSHPPSNAIYAPGTSALPPHILGLASTIKGLRRKSTYPMPTALRAVPGMNQRNGCLTQRSPLMEWYGDTRLFEERWWKFLFVGGLPRQELVRAMGRSGEPDVGVVVGGGSESGSGSGSGSESGSDGSPTKQKKSKKSKRRRRKNRG